MVIVLVPLLPWATVTTFGKAARLKPPNASTVSEIVVVSTRLPEVPVMVTVAVPTFAVLLAVSVRTLLEVAGFGLNDAVTPFGNPEATSVTLPVNPFTGVMVMVLVPLAPFFAMVTALDDGERLKPG